MTDGHDSDKTQNYCIIVPAYMEQDAIAGVVKKARRYSNNIIVIDDGSSDNTADEAEKAGATVIRHEENKGKGAALVTGFRYAMEHDFEFLITMDSDGQHDPDDIPKFVETYLDTGTPILIGNRMQNTGTMPLIRKLTNMFTSWMLSREMGQKVPDTQCGYRLFRCDIIPLEETKSNRYDAESEILLRIADRKIKMRSVPVATIYGEEKSKINPVRDTLRFLAVLRRHKSMKNSHQDKKEASGSPRSGG